MTTWPIYRDMTPEQITQWGRAEADARIADLSVRSPDGLIAAQRNASARRRAIGATIGQAASAVSDATREKRREDMRRT